MGTVNMHGLRALRLQKALAARGVRDLSVTFDPAAAARPKDELVGSVCTVLEAYLAGKMTPLARAARG